MKDRVVMASRFKQQCLALLDEVARTKVAIVVTKHNRPVARVVPLDDHERESLLGSVTFLTDDEDELLSTGETWEADSLRSP